MSFRHHVESAGSTHDQYKRIDINIAYDIHQRCFSLKYKTTRLQRMFSILYVHNIIRNKFGGVACKRLDWYSEARDEDDNTSNPSTQNKASANFI